MFRQQAWCIVLLCLAPLCLRADEPPRSGPMPGEPAPALVVSKWVRGDPVPRFEPGRLYVVDLWSTWCKPCLATMPHLSRLQAKHKSDLTVVAMNVWELTPARVPAVLKSLGGSMTVAMDSVPSGKEANEGLTAVAYMGTSFASIPRTFLIDREGRVAWIGTPLELEGPLAQVLAGTWEWKPFAKSYAAQMKSEWLYGEALSRVESAVAAADWEGAYKACEEAVKKDPTYAPRIANQGFAFLAMTILRLQERPTEVTALAQRASERALEVKGSADWRLSQLAAETAQAAGDRDRARQHLQQALETAPETERAPLRAALKALDKQR